MGIPGTLHEGTTQTHRNPMQHPMQSLGRSKGDPTQMPCWLPAFWLCFLQPFGVHPCRPDSILLFRFGDLKAALQRTLQGGVKQEPQEVEPEATEVGADAVPHTGATIKSSWAPCKHHASPRQIPYMHHMGPIPIPCKSHRNHVQIP